MLVLDENLPAGQRLLLRSWRIRFRWIGKEIAFSGAKDENLIPVLHGLSNPTFFSLDRDFYRRDLAHHGYCLVWLDVRGRQAAEFIRRFLRHPSFDTQAKRMGGRPRSCRRRALVAGKTTLLAVPGVANSMSASNRPSSLNMAPRWRFWASKWASCAIDMSRLWRLGDHRESLL